MTVPEGTAAHREEASRRAPLSCAVLTVSDSRTDATDESGPLARRLLEEAGHRIAVHALLRNDEAAVRARRIPVPRLGLGPSNSSPGTALSF